MPILRQSVAWARKLAEAYRPPNDRLLVKSKGILFLLIYVWIHTKKSPAGGASIKGNRPRQTKPYRIARQDADPVAILAHRYGGLDSTPEDLIDKLEDFS